MLKVKPPCCHHVHNDETDVDEPQLQGYRDTHDQHNRQEVTRLHQLELELDHGGPDEVGFHVSVDVHDMYEEAEDTTGFKRDLSSSATNPFHVYDSTEVTDETAGYLTRATYRYNQEMDEIQNLSHLPDPDIAELEGCALYGNTSTEMGLNYDQMEEIEGEIVEEVDYQNVTVVRTQLGHTTLEMEDANGHSPSCSDDCDQDYVSVDISGDSDEEDACDDAIHNSHMLGVEFAEGAHHRTAHKDATSLKSSQSYENFDPRQHRARTKQHEPKFSLEDVHTLSSNTGYQGSINVRHEMHSSQHDIDNDLYMNVPSIHSQRLA